METKEQKEKVRKDKMKKLGRSEQDEKRKNQSAKFLKKEDYLQIKVNFLERDKIQLELKNSQADIDRYEKTIFIIKQQVLEKKAKERKIIEIHEEFIENLKKRTGIDIRGKSIDNISLEVRDINE